MTVGGVIAGMHLTFAVCPCGRRFGGIFHCAVAVNIVVVLAGSGNRNNFPGSLQNRQPAGYDVFVLEMTRAASLALSTADTVPIRSLVTSSAINIPPVSCGLSRLLYSRFR